MNTKTYWCVDCPEGPMTEAEARWHAHHEGHCIGVPDDDEED